mgnify:CR=1 FL=1
MLGNVVLNLYTHKFMITIVKERARYGRVVGLMHRDQIRLDKLNLGKVVLIRQKHAGSLGLGFANLVPDLPLQFFAQGRMECFSSWAK